MVWHTTMPPQHQYNNISNNVKRFFYGFAQIELKMLFFYRFKSTNNCIFMPILVIIFKSIYINVIQKKSKK